MLYYNIIVFLLLESCWIINAESWYTGSMTPYNAVVTGNNILKTLDKFGDYKAIKLWSVFRHGERLPGEQTIHGMTNILDNFQKIILASGPDNKCYSEALRSWKVDQRLLNAKAKSLETRGRKTMRELGSRFKVYFPSIFNDGWNSENFEIKFTKSARTKESAREFLEGIFNDVNSSKWYSEVEPDDISLKFDTYCLYWKFEIKKKNKPILAQFLEGNEMKTTLENLKSRCAFPKITMDQMLLIYESCAFETAWNVNNSSPWCNLFTNEMLDVIQYYEDLELYLNDGYANKMNSDIACVMFNNMYEFLKKESGGKTLFLFSHIRVIVKFMTHLGLFNDGLILTPANYAEVKSQSTKRQWVSSSIAAFATNLTFILYRNSEGDEKIACMMNEEFVQIPRCSGAQLCSMNEFDQLFDDSIHKCYYEKWCKRKDANYIQMQADARIKKKSNFNHEN